MHELRWTLLILGVLFIVVLALWERRRPRQASEQSPEHRGTRADAGGEPSAPRVFREPTLTLPEIRVRESPQPQGLPIVDITEALRAERDVPSLPVLEPDMSASKAERAAVAPRSGETRPAEVRSQVRSDDVRPRMGQPNEVRSDEAWSDDVRPHEVRSDEAWSDDVQPNEVRPDEDWSDDVRSEEARFNEDVFSEAAAAAEATALPELTPADEPTGEATRDRGGDPYASAVPAEPIVEWPADEQRKVISLRLVAAAPERFPGRALRQALAAEGFVLGKFAIFHKADDDRRAYLSAASLTKPGTFDLETMDTQRYGGLSLFAVLPGPKAPAQAFDELLSAARNLNERLQGALQDEKGGPLTPTRIASLRESLATRESGATS